jgi:hypothetical protein
VKILTRGLRRTRLSVITDGKKKMTTKHRTERNDGYYELG